MLDAVARLQPAGVGKTKNKDPKRSLAKANNFCFVARWLKPTAMKDKAAVFLFIAVP